MRGVLVGSLGFIKKNVKLTTNRVGKLQQQQIKPKIFKGHGPRPDEDADRSPDLIPCSTFHIKNILKYCNYLLKVSQVNLFLVKMIVMVKKMFLISCI